MTIADANQKMAVDFAAGGCAALLAISIVHPIVSSATKKGMGLLGLLS